MSEVQQARTQVAGVILHQEGKVLLQHRDDNPEIFWPGAWAIFGGMVELGETPEEAVRREMVEELGLALDESLRLIYHSSDEKRERFFYAAPLTVHPEELHLQEGQGMALLGREQLEDYPVIPLHREVLEHFFRAEGLNV